MKAQDLKNSILQLAIQGKLVPQNPDDEPAEILYAKIQSEKQKLIKEGKIKKDKPLPPITVDEIPFDIPATWKWVRLGDICFLGTGAEVESHNLPLLDAKYLRGRKEAEFPLRGIVVNNGEYIILVDGENSGEVFYIKERGLLGSTFKKLSFISKPCIEYFLIVLKFYQKFFRDNKRGGAIPHLDKTLFRNICVGLPPLAEQKRIVAKIEEFEPLIKKYDKAETELTELNDNFPEQLKKSILQYAIEGKLVEQRSDEEPANILYEKIQSEKQKLIKESKIKKDKPLPPITADEIPFDIHDSWKWVRLWDLGLINPRNKLDDRLEVTFLPMTCLYSEYGKEADVSIIKKWKELKSGYTHIAENDVVIAKITPCFENGKAAILKGLKNNFGAGTTELHVFRSVGNVRLEYVLLFLKSPLFVLHAVANMTGTAGQQRVPASIFSECCFPLPPLAEQKRIVAKIEELFFFSNRI